jgi:hypothetical protein
MDIQAIVKAMMPHIFVAGKLVREIDAAAINADLANLSSSPDEDLH